MMCVDLGWGRAGPAREWRDGTRAHLLGGGLVLGTGEDGVERADGILGVGLVRAAHRASSRGGRGGHARHVGPAERGADRAGRAAGGDAGSRGGRDDGGGLGDGQGVHARRSETMDGAGAALRAWLCASGRGRHVAHPQLVVTCRFDLLPDQPKICPWSGICSSDDARARPTPSRRCLATGPWRLATRWSPWRWRLSRRSPTTIPSRAFSATSVDATSSPCPGAHHATCRFAQPPPRADPPD
jgi:hypothetical protein